MDSASPARLAFAFLGRGRAWVGVPGYEPGGRDYIPGSDVNVDYTDSVRDARVKEKQDIARKQPKYNKKGK